MNGQHIQELRKNLPEFSGLYQEIRELKEKLSGVEEKLEKLEVSMAEAKEMYDALKSILRVLSMLEKGCIFIVQISAAVGAMYASWKYVLVKIAEHIRNS